MDASQQPWSQLQLYPTKTYGRIRRIQSLYQWDPQITAQTMTTDRRYRQARRGRKQVTVVHQRQL